MIRSATPVTEYESTPRDRAVDVADRVVARHHLGRIFRAPVRHGTAGVVTARGPDGALQVAFVNGYTLRLHPDDVDLAGASDTT